MMMSCLFKLKQEKRFRAYTMCFRVIWENGVLKFMRYNVSLENEETNVFSVEIAFPVLWFSHGSNK